MALIALPLALGLSPMAAARGEDEPVPTTVHQHNAGQGSAPSGAEVKELALNPAGAELAARLASARPGDTVVVKAGEYQGNFVVRTPITLLGEGWPVLNGGSIGTVLTIMPEAAGTTVRGLRVVGSGTGPVGTPSGILVEADDVIVEGVEIADTYMGIQVKRVYDARILNNTIESFAAGSVDGEMHATGDSADMTGLARANSASSSGKMRGDAITLWNSTGTLVEGNTITESRDGIYLSFAEKSLLRDNEVRNSRYAMHTMYAAGVHADQNYFEGNLAGAILMYGGPFDLTRNTILHSRSPSTGIGIVVKDGGDVTITDNVVVANRVGIKLDNGGATSTGPIRALLQSNTIGLNQVGVEISHASRGSFTRNGFEENAVQVVVDGDLPSIDWTVAGVGNHWSTYKGYDLDGDGIGDLPFVEGGSIARTLVRSPVLMALASGPAFRLLQAVEDRWAPENPVVLDQRPLMERQSPSIERTRRPEAAPRWFGLSGVAVVLLAWLVLRWARTPRTEVRHG